MELSDSVTTQKFGHFEDKSDERDLEARLYAEIYYSNEVYGQDSNVEKQNSIEPGNSTKDVTPFLSTPAPRPSDDGDVNSALQKKQRQGSRLSYSKNTSNSPSSMKTNVKDAQFRSPRKKSSAPRSNAVNMKDLEGISTNSDAGKGTSSSQETSVLEESQSVGERVVKKTGGKTPKTDNQRMTKPYSSLSRRYRFSDEDIISRSACKEQMQSKYTVNPKKSKIPMRGSDEESVIVCSDSDESIFEVPVPPKPKPPVIQLVDSDEDCSENSDGHLKKKSNNRRSNEAADDAGNEFVHELDESLPSMQESSTGENQGKEPVINMTGFLAPNNETTVDSGIIENSEQIQDCFDETAREMESQETPSMITPDEARTGICDGVADLSNLSQRQQEITETIEIVNVSIDEHPESEISNKQTPRSSRKRQNDFYKPSGTPEIEAPKKRSKRNVDKANTEKSLAEYFFKPMSKQMQAFFNNPSGDENMDVQDIQSRMPKHPRFWTILDADLKPPDRRRKICPRCKTDSHFGRKCMEKKSTPSCAMCGRRGHTETRCPETMCLTCGRKYMTFRPTCNYCCKLHCDTCGGTGHTRGFCPDLWRRFHNTTTETIPSNVNRNTVMKSSEQLICCNCTQRGHDATTCRQLRWSQHFCTPTFVTSYTAGPLYPWMRKRQKSQEPREECPTSSKSVSDAIVEDTNRESLPKNCTQTSENQATPNDNKVELYRLGNSNMFGKTKFLESQKRLDTMENIRVDELLNRSELPVFLNVWKSVELYVEITHNPDDGSVLLIIRAKTEELLAIVEKLMIQWLTRSKFERSYMAYKRNRHASIKMITVKLKTGCCELRKCPPPLEALQNIHEVEKQCRVQVLAACQLPNTKINLKKLQNTIKNLKLRFAKNWHTLNTSLYKHSWIEGGKDIVEYYDRWATTIIANGKMRLVNYMKLLHVYNDLFPFYDSDHLNGTMQTSTFRLQPCKLIIDSLDTLTNEIVRIVPSSKGTIFTALQRSMGCSLDSFINSETSNPNAELVPNPQYCAPEQAVARNDTLAQNILPDDNSYGQVSFGVPRPIQLPGSFEDDEFEKNGLRSEVVNHENTDQCATNPTNNHISHDSSVFDQPAPDFIALNETHSFNFKNNQPPLTLRKKVRGKKKQQPNVCNDGLLINLNRKMKQIYRRSLRAALKLANSSNINRLQRFAKVLKFKVIDGTICTDDVHTLQRSLLRRLNPNPKVISSEAFETLKYAKEDLSRK